MVDPGQHVEEMLVDPLLPDLAVRRRSIGYVIHRLFSIGPVEFLIAECLKILITDTHTLPKLT